MRRRTGTVDPLAAASERIRARRMPLTVQRRMVLAAALGRDDHPTADDLHAEVAGVVPGIARGTVYRTLDTLVDLGLLVRVHHPGSAARYDARLERHHHLVCEACGAIRDLEDRRLDRLALPDTRKLGFRITDFSVHFRGLCRRCARSAGRSAHSSS